MAERLAASAIRGRTSATTPDAGRATLGPRVLAYLLDSLVLFVFWVLFGALAALVILSSSDFGEQNPSDRAFSIVPIVLLSMMPSWLLLNVLLIHRRGQTVGQYVVGLRVEMEDGSRPSLRQLAVYWLLLHPLLFHPLPALFWLVIVLASLGNNGIVVVSLALALLSTLAPVASLLFALADPQHRALHDRLAGLRVVHLQ
jgi:uncharacterized RDD family membrane protein YckC